MLEVLVRFVGTRQYLRPAIGRRLARLLFPLEKMKSKKFVVDLRGMKISGDLRIAQDYVVYFFGSYEPIELDLIEYFLSRQPGSVCFDVGCNMGQHALVMAKHSDQVFAFEPLETVRSIAEGRFSLNNLSNVSVLPHGLGKINEVLPFYFDAEQQNNATGSFAKEYQEIEKPIGELPIRKGDEVVQELGLSRLDFVKIDVEGWEGEVISGLERTIRELQPAIMFEVTQTSHSRIMDSGIFDLYRSAGYQLYEIMRGQPVLKFFYNSKFHLRRLDTVDAKNTSYNILAVPSGRLELIRSRIK